MNDQPEQSNGREHRDKELRRLQNIDVIMRGPDGMKVVGNNNKTMVVPSQTENEGQDQDRNHVRIPMYNSDKC
jgi:hypothetical protein